MSYENLEDDLSKVLIKYYVERHLDIYYQVCLQNDSTGYINFVYHKENIKNKTLSKVEIDVIQKLCDQLIFPARLDRRKNSTIILPTIEVSIEVTTSQSKIDFYWTNSEAMDFKNELRSLTELTETIEKLIDIDFSKLDMPIYM
jgi:hypothetical protein